MLIFVLSLLQTEPDLPFSDENLNGEKLYKPYEDDTSNTPPNNNNNNAHIKFRPKIIIPFYKLIKFREILVILLIIFSVVFFYQGNQSQQQILSQADKFVDYLGEYYAAVPHKFSVLSPNTFDQIISGRFTHLALHVVIKMTKKLDFLGYIYDKIKKNQSKLILEFLLDPPETFCGMIHISQEKPIILQKLGLKPRPLESSLVLFSDLEDSADPIFDLVNTFDQNHLGIIKMIELSDSNRFDMLRDGRYVARFEFSLENPEKVFIREVSDFCVQVADAFATLKVDRAIQQKNRLFRQQLFEQENRTK